MNSVIRATVVAVAMTAASLSQAQEKLNLRLLSSVEERFPVSLVTKEYIDTLSELSDGRISIAFSGPEVVAPNQQFEPVSRGVFDLAFQIPAYYLNTTGVMAAFSALPPDAQIWRDAGYWEVADKELERFNQKLLAFVPAGTEPGYSHLLLREPIQEGDKPLAGRKIRGISAYIPVVAPLGGTIVNLPTSEMYSALEKGVVDGAAFPIIGSDYYKMYEVTNYFMRPRFSAFMFAITMNLDRFNSLSEEDKQIFLEAGKEIEKTGPAILDEAALASEAELIAHGMEETTVDPEVFKGIAEDVQAGAWQTAIDGNAQTADRVKALKAMAVENGHAE